MPLTVLATRETLYLLKEDHQWRKSGAVANENKEPCSGNFTILETLPISCVSSVDLWPADQCRMDVNLYDEVSLRFVVILASAAAAAGKTFGSSSHNTLHSSTPTEINKQ